jgi:hypothetical protein
LKTGLVQNAWIVWWLKWLSRQDRIGFAKTCSGNRRSYLESWTYWPIQVLPHQGWSTHDSAPPFKGTPPYSCFEGNWMNKSKMWPPLWSSGQSFWLRIPALPVFLTGSGSERGPLSLVSLERSIEELLE